MGILEWVGAMHKNMWWRNQETNKGCYSLNRPFFEANNALIAIVKQVNATLDLAQVSKDCK